MTKQQEPDDEPDSLANLAEFTKRILQVPKSEIQDNSDSDGTTTIDEPCPE